MKIRFLRDKDASPDGYTVVQYQRGQVADLPEKLAEGLIREGSALSLEINGTAPEPDEGNYAEGVTPPVDDREVRELHAKGQELQKKLREAKKQLEQVAARRDRLQDQQAAAEVADLLGEDADVPADGELQEARNAVSAAREKVKRIRHAEQALAERLERRLSELDDSNAEAAAQAHADYVQHTADVVTGAVEAIRELQAFQERHKGFMHDLSGAAAPVDAARRLESWIERATDQ